MQACVHPTSSARRSSLHSVCEPQLWAWLQLQLLQIRAAYLSKDQAQQGEQRHGLDQPKHKSISSLKPNAPAITHSGAASCSHTPPPPACSTHGPCDLFEPNQNTQHALTGRTDSSVPASSLNTRRTTSWNAARGSMPLNDLTTASDDLRLLCSWASERSSTEECVSEEGCSSKVQNWGEGRQ